MHVESMVFIGWAATPVVAYVASTALMRRSSRRPGTGAGVDPTARLEELRQQSEVEWGRRGRMAEAIRLAEAPGRHAAPAHRA